MATNYKINLGSGQFTLVNKVDFQKLSKFRWHKSYYGYAIRYDHGKVIFMHRGILNAPKEMKIDHLNCNKLDNRRVNIRICTDSDNMKNRLKQINNSSGFKGVSFYKRTKKWRAYIKRDCKSKHIGYFYLPEIAAKAYDKLAIKYGFLKGNFYGN